MLCVRNDVVVCLHAGPQRVERFEHRRVHGAGRVNGGLHVGDLGQHLGAGAFVLCCQVGDLLSEFSL